MVDFANAVVPAGAPAFDHYLLQVATSPIFTDATEISIKGLANSQYTFPSDLDPNRNYYVRVKSYNVNGEHGAWSVARTFRTAILPPTLLELKDGSSTTNRKPIFNWSNVEGASNYIKRDGELILIHTFD
jgi:hypothetical protein